MVEPEQTSIARKRLGKHVSAATNINKDYLPLQQIAANESLPGSNLVKKVIPVTTKRTEELFDTMTFIPTA
jgi:hypothetical protein